MPGTWTNQNVVVVWICEGFDGDVAPLFSEPLDGLISTEGMTTADAPSPDCADDAGNTADVPTLPEAWIDKTKPLLTVDLYTNPSGDPLADDTWTNQDVDVDWVCTDDGDGYSPIATEPTDETITTEGVSYPAPSPACTDEAGNTADEPTPTVKIDTTNPSLTVDLYTNPAGDPLADDTWTNQDVDVDWVCTDGGDGYSPIATEPNDETVTTEGVSNPIPDTDCTDEAGNTADAPTPIVKIDKTNPLLTVDLYTNPGGDPLADDTWTNQDVDVDWTCTDDGDGYSPIATEPTDETITSEGTSTPTPSPACTDEAGNVADEPTPTVKIDKTEPTLSYLLANADTTAYTPGTWTNQDVTVDWVCTGFTGDVAPKATEPVDQTITAEGKITAATPAPDCADEAANVADVPTLPEVWIDQTAPVLTYTLRRSDAVTYVGPPYWTALTVTLDWTCTDPTTNAPDVSGPDGASFADVVYSTTGKHPTPTAETCDDIAGNTSDPVDVAPDEVWIDKTAPRLVVTFARWSAVGGQDTTPGRPGPTFSADFAKWYPHRIVAYIGCVDDQSGVGSNTYLDRMNFFADGAARFDPIGRCVDNVGNVYVEPMDLFVRVDTRAPKCDVLFSQKAKHGVALAIKVTVAASDSVPGSGIASAKIISISPATNFTGPAPLPKPSGTTWMFTGASGRYWDVVGKVIDGAGNERVCTGRLSSIR